jgi:aryl-alcohol dehydrogenase-like predicted oxidoreductase
MMRYSRRDVLKLGAGAGAALIFGRDLPALTAAEFRQQLLMRTIPKSGEQIPAVGLGTATTFMAQSRTPSEHAEIREVIRLFTELGGSVIDTAPTYQESEVLVGQLVREVGNADRIFMATKISSAGGRGGRGRFDHAAGLAQFRESQRRLAPMKISLGQLHNPVQFDWQQHLPILREAKQAGTIRYLGVTTSRDPEYERFAQILRTEDLDFVQFDYAVDNRNVEQTLLPVAKDRGLGVVVNMPFGGLGSRSSRNLFARTAGRELPDFAKPWANSWAQSFLKWILAEPAITVVVPATTDPGHLRDNVGAGLGRLPDANERKQLADYVDALPA